MPNPVNNRKGEQWEHCEQCGFLFPMSALTKQKGKLICTRNHTCFDDLEVERRDFVIERILNEGPEQEGADLRWMDKSYFPDDNERIY